MSRRMSNKDRLEQLRAEADAKEREKKVKKKAPKATPARRKKAEASVQLRVVWAVINQRGEVVKTYAYPDKDQAHAEAERRVAADGRVHTVAPKKVPVEP